MKYPSFLVIALAMAFFSCSTQEPSQRFLTAPMSITSLGEGGEKAERLRMRPIDLYNLFDKNVKGKKWKKVHENSWIIVIDGRDPQSGRINRMTITLAVDPEFNDTVVVTEVRESGGLIRAPRKPRPYH